MDFENFMAKKLGGKYKGPAPPSSPVRNSGSAPGPAPASSLDLTSGFSPLLYSTPNASSTSSRVDTGKKVDKLLRKQSLTRQQLNKIFPKRTDKILQLSKQQRETGKDLREKENVEGGEQVMANERAESTVVKDGNTIKSNIGFIRTTQEADYLMDDEEYDNGNDSGKGVEVGDEANNVVYEDFGAVNVVDNAVVDANKATENVTKTRAKKRKTAKEVRQAKPNPKKRSTARSHQNFRDRYLTVKKRVDVLQPDHGVEQDFFFAVKNNLQDPNVRGAASTAGKWMVYGKGEIMGKFLGGGIKYERKKMVMMANAVDFKQVNPKVNKNDGQESENSDDDGSIDDDLEEDGDTEESSIHVAKRQRREHDREDSPEPDLYDMGRGAISVRTPGS